MQLWVPVSVGYFWLCFWMGFLCSLFLQEPAFLVVRRFGKSVEGVSLGQGDSLTGLKVPSRNHWGSGMGSMPLLCLTLVCWVSVLKRNMSCFSLWCQSGYFTVYNDLFSCLGGVNPDIAPRTTIRSFCLGLFASVNTEQVRVVNLVFCYDFE